MLTPEPTRAYVWDALAPLRQAGEDVVCRTRGSLYILAKLPEGVDDMDAVRFLSHHHKVAVLPGKGQQPVDSCLNALLAHLVRMLV